MQVRTNHAESNRKTITIRKDKGNKKNKKHPTDKSSGKRKTMWQYKSESASGQVKQSTLEAFIPKIDTKTGGSHKS